MPMERRDFIDSTKRGVHEARQERSAITYDRIVNAARNLCDGRDFSAITVGDICAAADVSTSSFYARFQDRDALLHVLHEEYLEIMFQGLADSMSGVDWAAMTMPDVLTELGRAFLRTGRDYSPFMRSIARTEADSRRLIDRRIAFEKTAMDFVVKITNNRFDRTLDDDTRVRVRVALAAWNAALREILSPLATADVVGIGEDRLLRELAIQFCDYTKLPLDPVNARPDSAS